VKGGEENLQDEDLDWVSINTLHSYDVIFLTHVRLFLVPFLVALASLESSLAKEVNQYFNRTIYLGPVDLTMLITARRRGLANPGVFLSFFLYVCLSYV